MVNTIPETRIEALEREGRRMATVQRISLDPFVYCFEAIGDNRGGKYGYLVRKILVDSKQFEKVVTRLNSNTGCFADSEACDIMEAVVDYIQGDLFRHATEEDTSGMDHMWALGVILYFLLCGYPKLRGANQVECFDNMKIVQTPTTT